MLHIQKFDEINNFLQQLKNIIGSDIEKSKKRASQSETLADDYSPEEYEYGATDFRSQVYSFLRGSEEKNRWRISFNESYIKSPFFSRVVTSSSDVYIAKHLDEIPDPALFTGKIVPFTAEIAALRFEKPGNKGLTDKYFLDISDAKLHKMKHYAYKIAYEYDGSSYIALDENKPKNDIEVKIEGVIRETGEWVTGILGDAGAALSKMFHKAEKTDDSRAGHKKYVLGEIIELMREEQDSIMRAPIEGVTLIKGSAGSGKTNIAFHRIVYLVNEHSERFRQENIAVFCYNLSLQKYLMNMLKELHIPRVNILTLDKWALNTASKWSPGIKVSYDKDNNPESPESIKKSKEMEAVLRSFLAERSAAMIEKMINDPFFSAYEDILDRMHEANAILGINEIIEFFDNAKRKADSCELAKYSCLGIDMENVLINSNYIKENGSLRDKFIKINDISTFVLQEKSGKGVMEVNPEVKKAIFEYLSEIREHNSSLETKINAIASEFYYATLKFSSNDYTDYRINAERILDGIYRSKPFRDEVNRRKYRESERADRISGSDIIVFLWAIYLIDKQGFPKYDHLIVDEVQDVSPMQIKLLNMLSNNSMTIAGDLTQSIYRNTAESWADYGINIDFIYELRMCHRSTLETMLFANMVAEGGKSESLAEKVGKRGDKPLIIVCSDMRNSVLATIRQINEIKRHDKESSVVVVYPFRKDLNNISETFINNGLDSYVALRDSWEFSSKVSITTYHQIKGLEFDYVFILGANEYEKMNNDSNENLFYTVITRAQKRVFINCVQNIPKILSSVDRGLYELVNSSS